MRGRSKAQSAIAPLHVLRRFVTLAALLVFTWQCILVQSHVHGPQAVPSGSHVVKVSAPVAPAGPDNDDPANCPLCQEMLHAGTYVTPVAAILYLPVAAVFIAAPVFAAVRQRVTPSHNWQGRAPPRI